MSNGFPPAGQVPGVFHYKLGDVTVTAFNDGYLDASFDIFAGITPEEAEKLETSLYRRSPPRLTVNAFVVSGPKGVTLIDGGGAGFTPTMGNLSTNLAAAGIAAADVTTILVTHLHPDHVGAFADASGKPHFPNAELVGHESEFAFWLDESLLGKTPEASQGFVKAAQAAAHAYDGKRRGVTDGEAVPGITAVHLPGHTVGHTGWRIDAGGKSLLMWGDIVHMPGLQFARPEVTIAFDADPAQAQATRKRALDMAASDGLLVSGSHLDFPAFGHVLRAGSAYAWTPASWVTAF